MKIVSAGRRFLSGLATLMVGLATLGSAGQATAGAISTPSLTGIFSQASFGAEPITVNWLAPGPTIVNPLLATIDNASEATALFALAPNEFPAVSVFFVDAINFCDGGGSFIGCAQIRGHDLLIKSSFAAGSIGNIGIAHELAHNLGLPHDASPGNLMNPILSSTTTTLTAAQAFIILNNQSDLLRVAPDGSVFINLRPIAVIASVPEPEPWLMLACGMLAMALALRHKSRARPEAGVHQMVVRTAR